MGYDTDVDNFPITPTTLNDFTDQIVNVVKNKQSITFVFPEFFGGERSWLKFILYTNLTNLKTKLEGYKFVYFEPAEIAEDSKTGFFAALLKSTTGDKNFDENEHSLNDIFTEIDNQIESITKTNKLVIFIAKLSSFKTFDENYGNKLYCFWKNRKDKVSFVITMSPRDINEFIKNRSGEFCEVLLENVKTIQKLEDPDILFSISHWENKLGAKFTAQEKKLILKHAAGSPFKSKVLCQNLATYRHRSDLDEYMRTIIQSRFSIHVDRKKLKHDKSEGIIYYGSEIYGGNLTPSEYDILKYLIDNGDMITTRDNIADILWGKNQFERYSDWAIDKIISNLRKKLEPVGHTIITAKGRGFYLSPLT